jgi:hypothetical protein
MQKVKNKLNLTASIAMIYMAIKKRKSTWERNTGRTPHKYAR